MFRRSSALKNRHIIFAGNFLDNSSSDSYYRWSVGDFFEFPIQIRGAIYPNFSLFAMHRRWTEKKLRKIRKNKLDVIVLFFSFFQGVLRLNRTLLLFHLSIRCWLCSALGNPISSMDRARLLTVNFQNVCTEPATHTPLPMRPFQWNGGYFVVVPLRSTIQLEM